MGKDDWEQLWEQFWSKHRTRIDEKLKWITDHQEIPRNQEEELRQRFTEIFDEPSILKSKYATTKDWRLKKNLINYPELLFLCAPSLLVFLLAVSFRASADLDVDTSLRELMLKLRHIYPAEVGPNLKATLVAIARSVGVDQQPTFIGWINLISNVPQTVASPRYYDKADITSLRSVLGVRIYEAIQNSPKWIKEKEHMQQDTTGCVVTIQPYGLFDDCILRLDVGFSDGLIDTLFPTEYQRPPSLESGQQMLRPVPMSALMSAVSFVFPPNLLDALKKSQLWRWEETCKLLVTNCVQLEKNSHDHGILCLRLAYSWWQTMNIMYKQAD